ncbi:MAG: prolyl oligopeptidase family serine peptidase [Candidatus Anammoximicrobium sp.]|nr:prolyl oligopeptidase family serine peptidase [Candidatus Anammoximicrobium sp.]
MKTLVILLVFLGWTLNSWSAEPERLGPGDHHRALQVAGQSRSYLAHVPPEYDAAKPTPVVLIFHGAGMNATRMRDFSSLNGKADEAGFVAVYPNGTGTGPFLTFNSGGVEWGLIKQQPDDVAFVAKLLDDLATVVNVDANRVYATGMSNGGMMCYRLAAELSDRIAAVAPVAGTMAETEAKPKRPVSVLHFHGTDDRLVPYGGLDRRVPKLLTFKSVEDSVATWVKWNGCRTEPLVEELPDTVDDGTKVTRKTYRSEAGVEVVLVIVTGGGHTWPGRQPPLGLIGRSTRDICAADMIWDFFLRHPLKNKGNCGESPYYPPRW